MFSYQVPYESPQAVNERLVGPAVDPNKFVRAFRRAINPLPALRLHDLLAGRLSDRTRRRIADRFDFFYHQRERVQAIQGLEKMTMKAVQSSGIEPDVVYNQLAGWVSYPKPGSVTWDDLHFRIFDDDNVYMALQEAGLLVP